MVLPKSNRCVMFDAQYLHGVIPGRGVNSSPHSNTRRLTFMVGFWKDIAAKDRGAKRLLFFTVFVVGSVSFVCLFRVLNDQKTCFEAVFGILFFLFFICVQVWTWRVPDSPFPATRANTPGPRK